MRAQRWSWWLVCVAAAAVGGCSFGGKVGIAFHAAPAANGQTQLTCERASGGACLFDVEGAGSRHSYRVPAGGEIALAVPESGLVVCGRAAAAPDGKCTSMRLKPGGFAGTEQSSSTSVALR